jgi:hypothetical protein
MSAIDPTAIEVEVVAIDGAPPAVATSVPESEPRQQWQEWRSWQGRVRTLDARWWPLWILLGIVALVLVATLGLLLGVVVLIVKTARGLLHALFSLFSPRSRSTSLR